METKDGIFFCAMMSVGILLVGLLVGMFLTSTTGVTIPKFEPLAAVGGCMWMLGNLMCPYIIQLIGAMVLKIGRSHLKRAPEGLFKVL